MSAWFDRFARRVAELSGTHWAFGAAVLLIVVWLVSGPMLGFSTTWQLVINTGTTIITFLMVFVIQHTQNVHETAMQRKLDEVIRALPDADNTLRGIEEE